MCIGINTAAEAAGGVVLDGRTVDGQYSRPIVIITDPNAAAILFSGVIRDATAGKACGPHPIDGNAAALVSGGLVAGDDSVCHGQRAAVNVAVMIDAAALSRRRAVFDLGVACFDSTTDYISRQILVDVPVFKHGNGFVITVKVVIPVADDEFLRRTVDAAAIIGGSGVIDGSAVYLHLNGIPAGKADSAAKLGRGIVEAGVDDRRMCGGASEAAAVAGIRAGNMAVVKRTVNDRCMTFRGRTRVFQGIHIKAAAVSVRGDTVVKCTSGHRDVVGAELQAACRLGFAAGKGAVTDRGRGVSGFVFKFDLVEHRARLPVRFAGGEGGVLQRHMIHIGVDRAAAVTGTGLCGIAVEETAIRNCQGRAFSVFTVCDGDKERAAVAGVNIQEFDVLHGYVAILCAHRAAVAAAADTLAVDDQILDGKGGAGGVVGDSRGGKHGSRVLLVAADGGASFPFRGGSIFAHACACGGQGDVIARGDLQLVGGREQIVRQHLDGGGLVVRRVLHVLTDKGHGLFQRGEQVFRFCTVHRIAGDLPVFQGSISIHLRD